ncbi:MAG: hypothetical protein J6I40_02185 [Mailhella sp.]|nr:hypothetical protein [Mailhella sp.]
MDFFAELFLRGIRYEQWLRFYFMEGVEKNPDAAVISVPEWAAARSRQGEPDLCMLLEAVNGKKVSLESSKGAVLRWMVGQAGISLGEEEFEARLQGIAANPEVRLWLDMFSGWVQSLADGETAVEYSGGATTSEQDVPSFTAWSDSFLQWLQKKHSQSVSSAVM